MLNLFKKKTESEGQADNQAVDQNKGEEEVTDKGETAPETEQTPEGEQAPEAKETATEEQPEVEEENPPTAIKVEDLMLKADFEARFAAFEAKYDALFKENADLKDKLNEMSDKYENKDFGTQTPKGNSTRQDKKANESFDEYAKQFT